MNECGLGIFVKTPGLSPVKTRLAAALGEEKAGEFYLLSCAACAAVARQAAEAATGPDFFLTPYWAVAEGRGVAQWPGFTAFAQGEGDLGTRLAHVYARLWRRHGAVILIGADCPQLTAADLLEAGRLTRRTGAFALGLARDGGFYLLAGSVAIPPELWRHVTYSDSKTAAQLRAQLVSLAPVRLLKERSDVDTVEDLAQVQRELRALPNPLPEQRQLADWLQTVL